jgi:hypothetical protein
MALNGFTWNMTPAQANLLAMVLRNVALDRCPGRTDQHIASLFLKDLEFFLRMVPDGYTQTPLLTNPPSQEGVG